jgi:hypothetical protein
MASVVIEKDPDDLYALKVKRVRAVPAFLCLTRCEIQANWTDEDRQLLRVPGNRSDERKPALPGNHSATESHPPLSAISGEPQLESTLFSQQPSAVEGRPLRANAGSSPSARPDCSQIRILPVPALQLFSPSQHNHIAVEPTKTLTRACQPEGGQAYVCRPTVAPARAALKI